MQQRNIIILAIHRPLFQRDRRTVNRSHRLHSVLNLQSSHGRAFELCGGSFILEANYNYIHPLKAQIWLSIHSVSGMQRWKTWPCNTDDGNNTMILVSPKSELSARAGDPLKKNPITFGRQRACTNRGSRRARHLDRYLHYHSLS